jgi:hypothetical protein
MATIMFSLMLAANVLCIHVARSIALTKGWSAYGWMLAAALLGPAPLPLMVLIPGGRRRGAASSS